MKTIIYATFFFIAIGLAYGEESKPAISSTSQKFSFVSIELGWAFPVGATGKYAPSQFPDQALGMESGPYLGIAHNSNLIQVGNIFGAGWYGQFGFQMNPLNDGYEDYGYDVTSSSYRLEYEIGPSITFSLGHKLYVDAYFKAGLAIIYLPYFKYREEDDENYDQEKDAHYEDEEYDPWEREYTDGHYVYDNGDTTLIFSDFDMINDAINSGLSFGFVYGFGFKFRYSLLELGVDINLGKEKFIGDYDDLKVPVSAVRTVVGIAF